MSKIKIILTIICLVIVFAGVVYIDNFYLNNSIIKDTRLYSGPVQEGYDEDCFRKIGLSIKLGEVCE